MQSCIASALVTEAQSGGYECIRITFTVFRSITLAVTCNSATERHENLYKHLDKCQAKLWK